MPPLSLCRRSWPPYRRPSAHALSVQGPGQQVDSEAFAREKSVQGSGCSQGPA